MVPAVRAVLDTSSPKLSAILVTIVGSSGIPPMSIAAISRRARSTSGISLARLAESLKIRLKSSFKTQALEFLCQCAPVAASIRSARFVRACSTVRPAKVSVERGTSQWA